MNHPCAGCSEPVHSLGESELPHAKYWHGDCYLDYLHGIVEPATRLIIGYSTHDERVADGMEKP